MTKCSKVCDLSTLISDRYTYAEIFFPENTRICQPELCHRWYVIKQFCVEISNRGARRFWKCIYMGAARKRVSFSLFFCLQPNWTILTFPALLFLFRSFPIYWHRWDPPYLDSNPSTHFYYCDEKDWLTFLWLQITRKFIFIRG